MKIFSKTLNKEIEITTYEKDGLFIVSHSELKQIMAKLNVERTDVKYIRTDKDHSVVDITFKNLDNGKTYSDIGESDESTLSNAIAKSIPVTTAYNRAFDRVAIQLLGIEGRFYSDQELSTKGAKQFINKDSVPSTVPENPEIEDMLEIDLPLEEKPEEKPEEKIKIKREEPKTEVETDDFVVSIGRYNSNPMKMSEIATMEAKKGNKWLTFIANGGMNATTKDVKVQVEKIKAYIIKNKLL